MTSYRDGLLALVADTETRTGTVYDIYEAGDATEVEFTAATTATIQRGEERGVALSDVALASFLTGELRRAVPTLGLVTSDADRQATAKAVRTLTTRLTETDEPRARATRLARGRVTKTAGRYFDVGLTRHAEISGYTRGLSATACELCVWLYRGGHIYPATQPMHRHPGCTCIPLPTLLRQGKAA